MNNDNQIGGRQIFADDDPGQRMLHVAQLVQDTWPELGSPRKQVAQEVTMLLFDKNPQTQVRIKRSDDGKIYVGIQVTPAQPYLAMPPFTELLKKLAGRWQWFSGEKEAPSSIRIFTLLDNGHGGMLGDTVFKNQFFELMQWCETLCPGQCATYDETALLQSYKQLQDVLTPLLPWQRAAVDIPQQLLAWVDDVYELLSSGFPVGVTGESPVERRLALALLAERCLKESSSLGRLTLAGIEPHKLVHLLKEAPGFVVVPARSLQININPYERGDAVKQIIRILVETHKPCIFEGGFAEMQELFNGGQGGEQDPLNPAVCRIPEIPLEVLAHFAIFDASQSQNVPKPLFMDVAVKELCKALDNISGDARRFLVPMADHVLKNPFKTESYKAFAHRLSSHTETFGAIGVHPKTNRSQEVQKRLQDRFISSEFQTYLKGFLFGQDSAIEDYALKLQEEVFTRPLHQPMVVALQGSPGTGKSECLGLTAEWLEVPHVVIDAASMPEPYIAMAQLLGSGRGIIGSHQAGRLEQVARHHLGAVVEIADIDHAVPAVRSALGDLFLQIMQTGMAQSSIGHLFSCSGLLLAFSLNLPGGKDEKAYQRVGFGKAPSVDDVRRDVHREIKNMVSGAFLSRLGEPVLFEPLSEDARTNIVYLALKDALQTSMDRLGINDVLVEMDRDVAAILVQQYSSSVITFGARGLVDMARRRVVKALLAWQASGTQETSGTLKMFVESSGEITIAPEQPSFTATPIPQ